MVKLVTVTSSLQSKFTADDVTLQLVNKQFSIKNLGVDTAQIAANAVDLTKAAAAVRPVWALIELIDHSSTSAVSFDFQSLANKKMFKIIFWATPDTAINETLICRINNDSSAIYDYQIIQATSVALATGATSTLVSELDNDVGVDFPTQGEVIVNNAQGVSGSHTGIHAMAGSLGNAPQSGFTGKYKSTAIVTRIGLLASTGTKFFGKAAIYYNTTIN